VTVASSSLSAIAFSMIGNGTQAIALLDALKDTQ
jgi:hypothetical protein